METERSLESLRLASQKVALRVKSGAGLRAELGTRSKEDKKSRIRPEGLPSLCHREITTGKTGPGTFGLDLWVNPGNLSNRLRQQART